ncbi:MAG TPA: phosphatase PAP2 family protein [Gemmatimonadaceae bacterium]|jgi:undecaprenyl-diphosphatase
MTDSIRRRPSLAERGRQFLVARFNRKSQLGIGLTAAVVVCALAIWAFSGLLDAILDNDALVRWDAIVEGWFHTHATPTGLAILNAVTQLGSPGVAVVVTVVAIYLWRKRVFLLLWTWLGAILGGLLIEHVLKNTVHRSRPQYAAAYLHGQSYSFPSGHTMASTICYLLLAFLIWSHPSTRPTVRRGALIVAAAVITAVGFSRLYLGVHYPSDVLGGLLAGIGWLGVCGATRRFFAARDGLLDGGWRRPTLESE